MPNLQKSVAENDLLIVDAHKARVLVEPDAEEFVRLQAERHRARVLLGAAHTPAQTQAGRAVPVWASVRSARELSDALAWGADGIVVEAGGDLTGEIAYAASFEPDENDPFPDVPETMSLLSVVEAVGGGAVGLNACRLKIWIPRSFCRWLPFPNCAGPYCSRRIALDAARFAGRTHGPSATTKQAKRTRCKLRARVLPFFAAIVHYDTWRNGAKRFSSAYRRNLGRAGRFGRCDPRRCVRFAARARS